MHWWASWGHSKPLREEAAWPTLPAMRALFRRLWLPALIGVLLALVMVLGLVWLGSGETEMLPGLW